MHEHDVPASRAQADPERVSREEIEELRAAVKLLESDMRILSHQCVRLQAENRALCAMIDDKMREFAVVAATGPAVTASGATLPAMEPTESAPPAMEPTEPAPPALEPTEPAPAALPCPQNGAASRDGRFWGGLLDRFHPHRRRQWLLRRQAARCVQSGLFDVGWYLEKYPDVAAAHIDPALHFVQYGVVERRSPNPDFNWDTDADKLRDIFPSRVLEHTAT